MELWENLKEEEVEIRGMEGQKEMRKKEEDKWQKYEKYKE